jgi:hypothetical protein
MEEVQIKGEKKENQGDRSFIQREVYTQCGYNAKLGRYMQYCRYTTLSAMWNK